MFVDYDVKSEDETDISFHSDLSCDDFDYYRIQLFAVMEDCDDLNTEDENDNSKHDAKIVRNDEFEPHVGRRNPEIGDWIVVK